mgnify:CR=1 FL=1
MLFRSKIADALGVKLKDIIEFDAIPMKNSKKPEIKVLLEYPGDAYDFANAVPPLSESRQRSLDWERIQREKAEARRLARRRCAFDCLLLACVCVIAVGAFLGLLLLAI